MFKDLFDKNTLFGVLIIIGMFWAYFIFSKNRFEEQKLEQNLAKQHEASSSVKDTVAKATLDTAHKAETTLPLPTGENLTLSNNLISINVNTVGAKLNNAVLKKHTTHQNKQVELLNDKSTNFDLKINKTSMASQGFQVISKSDSKIELGLADGTKMVYSIDSNSYIIRQNWTLPVANSSCQLVMNTEMSRQEINLARERQFSTINYLIQGEEGLSYLNAMKNEELSETKSMKWISFGQQFFNASVMPVSGFTSAKMSSYYLENDTNYVKKYKVEANIAPSQNLAIDYFVGPSSYSELKKTGHDLEKIVPLSYNFVLFRWMKIFNLYLIIPMFEFLSKFISSYGIIILVMTLLIKILTAPLSYKQYRSGVAMKILKPDLDKLKAKYGDDNQKLSQEQMKLYNEVGANPMGGCLPMLLQMPILISMYNFFPACVELRHEPFLWAKDLSTFDSILSLPNIPFYGDHVSLFALLSAGTQIATTVYAQRLQPSSPQADQMKMMTYIMPIMFLFMFNSFPAALTFYFFLQNVLSVLQQWFFTTFVIKEDVVRAEMDIARKTPKKQGKLAKIMEQAEAQRQLQQKQNKK